MTEIQTNTLEKSYISISVPAIIKKRGGRGSTTIITPPKDKTLPPDDNTNYDYRLITAITRAYKLQQKMNKNPEQTISSLAYEENLTRGYLGRLLRLNMLAPDIVKAILDGKQPKDLRLIDFLRKDIPLLWDDQKKKFGFDC